MDQFRKSKGHTKGSHQQAFPDILARYGGNDRQSDHGKGCLSAGPNANVILLS